jgi:hypothetical protein
MAAGKTTQENDRGPGKDHQHRRGLVRRAAVALLLSLTAAIGSPQELTPVVNSAFIPGELLRFKVYYDSYLTGKVVAGTASLEVKFEKKDFEGRPVYHTVGEGKSKGAFNFFFKVEDRFESYIDAEFLFPLYFIRRTREGDYRKNDEVRFNHQKGSAVSRSKTKKIPPGTQDIISAFYYARTIDISGLKPGDYFNMPFYLDDSVYVSRVYFDSRETVKTDAGTFKCMKFKPMVATGGVFGQPYPMAVWVTDDQYRIPVLAQSAVIVGSVKMELVEYKGVPGVPPSRIP